MLAMFMRHVIFVVVVWSVFFLIHVSIFAVMERTFAFIVPYSLLWAGGLAALYFVASAAARRYQGMVSDTFYYVAAAWLGVVWLLFCATTLYTAVYVAWGEEVPVLFVGLLMGAVALALYALWNARQLVVTEHTLTIAGLTAPLTLVHLTDLHVGTVNQQRYLERVVTRTNTLGADLVLITGDLFDGSVEIDESILVPLNTLTAPAYFSMGNHELYEGLDHVRTTIGHLRVQLLENDLVEFQGVQIVGVNDRQSLPKATTLDAILSSFTLVPGQPAILMYHTPVEWEAARKHGIDVMLSGHTHNGQIYPFTLVIRMFYRYIKGLYSEEGKYLHVSPGTGTWGPPMRLGSRNQITLLRLVPLPRSRS